jgi:benzil reductase ((S)-benzoin forming)
MRKTILITGASSGIGKACVECAVANNLQVIATARNLKILDELRHKSPNVQSIVADISIESGRNKISQSVNQPIDYCLHNAALLYPPQSFEELLLENLRNTIATNVEPIIFLTQGLLPYLKQSSIHPRILSISSGAAKTAIVGIGNYCISKAAALMANQVLKAELSKDKILVNDYFPGVVNTSMQKTLRSSTVEIFPYSEQFKELKRNNQLANPDDIANHLIKIFTKTTDTEFLHNEWSFA